MELADLEERIDSLRFLFVIAQRLRGMPTKAEASGVERGSGVKVGFSFYEVLIGAIRRWRFPDNVFGFTLALWKRIAMLGLRISTYIVLSLFVSFFLLRHTLVHVTVTTSCLQSVVSISFARSSFTRTLYYL